MSIWYVMFDTKIEFWLQPVTYIRWYIFFFFILACSHPAWDEITLILLTGLKMQGN